MKIFWFLWAIAMLLIMYVGIVYRFIHPELTETQLFLSGWYLYLISFICLITAFFIAIYQR